MCLLYCLVHTCTLVKCNELYVSSLLVFREVKVRVLKSDPLAWVTGSLTRRKTSTESFLLTLQRVTNCAVSIVLVSPQLLLLLYI